LKKEYEIPVKKNQELEVEIIDLTHEGLGVAKIAHYPLFIENALPTEIVKVHVLKVGKKFGYAKVLDYIKTSKDRVEGANNQLIRTGIAPLQHLTYPAQLIFKRNQIVNVLAKTAKLPEVSVLSTIGMEQPYGYRNKAQIPVRKVNGELETGFFKKNSHELVPMTDFYIQDPKIDEAIVIVRNILRKFNVKPYDEVEHTGNIRNIIVRRGHYSHEMMIILVTRTEKIFKNEQITSEIVKALPEVFSVIHNIQPAKSNAILGKESRVLFGKDSFRDELLGHTFQISPQSFYQVNTEMAEKLYQIAIDFADLKPEDIAIDAYCGIGTIGQSFAKKVKHVYGVEIVKEAIQDAKINANLNDIENATYEVGSAENVMHDWVKDGIKPSVVFVDPPRKGLTDSFIRATAEVQPEKVIYISCNAATFARDVKLFDELGYKTEKVQPVDLFPQTYHVELVALLQRVK
jgi:23S rRNA (uracil1939-C5)-methyltransferase